MGGSVVQTDWVRVRVRVRSMLYIQLAIGLWVGDRRLQLRFGTFPVRVRAKASKSSGLHCSHTEEVRVAVE